MQGVWNWLKTFNVSTHTIAVAALALTIAFKGYQPFHDWVTGIYTGFPSWLQVLIGTGGFLFALYKSGALTQNSSLTGKAQTPGGATKLGAWALVAVLLMGTMTACAPATVAEDIVKWTPALDSAAATVASLDQALVPEAAAFVALANAVDAEAKAYLAAPTATLLTKLQRAVVAAQQQVNVALLAAVHITGANAQHVLATLQTFATIVNTILALVVSISPKAAVTTLAAAAPIKLREIDASPNGIDLAVHYGVSREEGARMAREERALLTQAGF